jgi:adenine phosphoribosyltransferase
MTRLKDYIRDIPNFPKEGIIFHDITPLLQNAKAFEKAIEDMAELLNGQEIDSLVGIEARGFIFASALALKLGTGLVIVRKPGKLPYVTINATYNLEYGSDSLEVHRDAVHEGSKVVLIDDLLATGGTGFAAAELVEKLGGQVLGHCFLVELTELKGRDKLLPHEVWSVLKYSA